jgi:L-malate glycosyltransferase
MTTNTLADVNRSIDAASPDDRGREDVRKVFPSSVKQRLRRWIWHFIVRHITLLSQIALVLAGCIGRSRRRLRAKQGCEILLTGRFSSDNWILAFLEPLSASKECSRIWMVSTNPVPSIPKVESIYPPKWLMKILGVTPARILTFTWAALCKRPHVVGGFHLLVNGIAAAIIGRLAGARSIYFCVGGPAELRDGGVHSTDNYFRKMETSDSIVEARLLKITSVFDTIITMGTGAIRYLREKGVNADFQVVAGAINSQRFQPVAEDPTIDIIVTGRLVPIKRIDIFLQAVRVVVQKIPDVKAVVVGDGELRKEMLSLAMELGIETNVHIAGYQDDLIHWLQKTKIFLLTSDSEGLSLSMMEAMMCGLPAVVSDVGDLGDLVENGVNGYLVPRRSPKLFADRLIELLLDPQKLKDFSQAARRSALRYGTQNTIEHWDEIITDYRTV